MTKVIQLKEQVLDLIKDIEADKGKILTSSFTLPVWNAKRLKAISKKLQIQGIKINTTELAIQCLLLFQRKIKRKNCQINRTVRKNKTISSFEKISIRFTPFQYNAFYLKKNHLKISTSYMFDLAIRFYLNLIYKLLLYRKSKFEIVIKYHRKTRSIIQKTLFIKEKVKFYIKLINTT